MKVQSRLTILLITLLVTSITAWARVTTDYDHNADFTRYKTYSWAKVQTQNALWDERVKEAVNRELADKGWREVPSGADAVLTVRGATQDKKQLETFYDGMGGWRWGGFGTATTTVDTYKVGTLVVDMFDASTKSLIWRGAASDVLSGNVDKNIKNLNKEVHKMLQHFPPEPKK